MKILLVITGTALGLQMSAQKMKEAAVPASVKESFAKQFPGVSKPEWEKEGNMYEAEFTVKRVNMDNGRSSKSTVEKSAVFDANGALQQTEEEIAVSSLPAAVHEYVKKNLEGKKVSEAAKITDTKGEVTYEAEVAKTDYLFDSQGNFLKKESEKDKDDDDKK